MGGVWISNIISSGCELGVPFVSLLIYIVLIYTFI